MIHRHKDPTIQRDFEELDRRIKLIEQTTGVGTIHVIKLNYAYSNGATVESKEDNTPPGFLLANGQTVLQADYPELYKKYGHAFIETATIGVANVNINLEFALPNLNTVSSRSNVAYGVKV